jgi:hypothetical protein
MPDFFFQLCLIKGELFGPGQTGRTEKQQYAEQKTHLAQ